MVGTVRYQDMLMVLLPVNKSLSCFLKIVNIYIILDNIILMICMLLKIKSTIFERLHNCENFNM